MELFYTPQHCIDIPAGTLVVEGEEYHHLARVLRKRTGEAILVTDGKGARIEARIAGIGKKSLECDIVSTELVALPATRLTIALSLLKSPQRFDLFLEKATELGVSAIVPMVSARTVSQPKREKTAGKLERWQRIVLSAARQSKRYHLPEISEPMPFADVLGLEGYDLKLIPYESSREQPAVECRNRSTLIVVGGEGGFTPGEVRSACDAGFREVSFGRSILRAETAALFAAAFVRAQLLDGPADGWL